MLTVRDIQRPVIEALLRYSRQVGAQVYLADSVMSARPTFWFCGTPIQRSEVLSLLRSQKIRIFGLQGQKRVAFNPDMRAAEHAILYQKRANNNGIVIHGASSGIEVAFCFHDESSDSWRTSRAGLESDARRSYLESLDETQFLGVRLPELRGAKALRKQREAQQSVDLVYTWVDGSDPAWQKRRIKEEERLGRFTYTKDATHSSRYNSQSELLFSVRSAFRYFVNIGSVYIVTDQQIPDFLGDLLDKVTIIDHSDIFPESSMLPSFNSHSIEANLHRIPGLREYYLYLNDDVAFSSAMSSSDFFDEYGRIRQFYSNAASLPAETDPDDFAVNTSGINNRNLIFKKFGLYPFRKFRHVALPTRKSIMEEMERELPAAWSATLPNRFRSPNDYSIAGALFQQYAAATGRAIPGGMKYGYFDSAKPESAEAAKELQQDDWVRPQMFCVNDTLDTEESELTKERILEIVDRLISEEDGIVENFKNNDVSSRRRFYFFGPRAKPPGLDI
ncbi:MAG: stealth conserved region 3 domain-containing protein [Albidovulum sp.]|uniref:Stealth CR1 domain-containing protein n=1 Tax=Albidovulum sp. TaxID=1872424 RepID=UPI003C93E97F